jgi:hypothetical protein
MISKYGRFEGASVRAELYEAKGLMKWNESCGMTGIECPKNCSLASQNSSPFEPGTSLIQCLRELVLISELIV